MKLAHSAPRADIKVLKFLKSGMALILAVMIALSVFFSVQFTWSADAIAQNNGQTKYSTVSEFQKARWKEIQSEIFSDVNFSEAQIENENISPLQPGEINSKKVEEGNDYFNWVDTGLTAWDGNPSSSFSYNSTREVHNYDGTEVSYYVYDVDTPGKLRRVLQDFNSLFTTSSARYIKVNITADLDMGGQDGKTWDPIDLQYCVSRNYKRYLYIEGNGHTIYNLKIYNDGNSDKACGLFANPPAFMVVKNLGFMSSMMLNCHTSSNDDGTQSGLICAYLPQKMYMYNVHSSGGYYQNYDDSKINLGGIGGLVGRKNIVANPKIDWGEPMQITDCGDTFFENCSTEKLYMYARNHIGGFSSFMCTKAKASAYQYGGSFPETPEKYVYESGFLSSISQSKIINSSSSYPIMLKNCSSTDCEMFSRGNDSGAFVSCGTGHVMEGCFTNNTLYSSDNSGGFIGRVDSTKDPCIKDSTGQYALSSTFTDCYASGIIEGRVAMGGFVGLDNSLRYLKQPFYRPTVDSGSDDGNEATGNLIKVFETQKGATVYNNCYSTAMVGMDYAGKYVGGFIGLDDNYNKSATITADGTTFTGNGSFYLNCYAAGEVGNILTITDTAEAIQLEKEYFDKNNGYEGKDTREVILDYYPTGGFAGVVGIDNYENKYTYDPTGIFHNCYYDKQTTAMHEMAIGLSNTKTAYTAGGQSLSINNTDFFMDGITGLYTQNSDVKNVEGLTDMTHMDTANANSSTWQYENEYYPQLKRYMISDITKSSLSDVDSSYLTDKIKKSEFFTDSITDDLNEYSVPVLSLAGASNTDVADAQMAQIIRAYRVSQASTATVLLDHWDIVMDTDTGLLENENTAWLAESRNKLTQYYVDRYTGDKVAHAKYYDSDGEEIDNASYAAKVEIVSENGGEVLATLDTSEGYFRDARNTTEEHPNGVPVDSIYDISVFNNTIDEWQITFKDLDKGSYNFKIEEGLGAINMNYGATGYDGSNMVLDVPSSDCEMTIRFHCGGVSSPDYYVVSECKSASGDITKKTIAQGNGTSIPGNTVLYLRGGFNNWDTSEKMSYAGTDSDGNVLYSYTRSLDGGYYEFKIGSADWSESYGQNGWGDNMNLNLSDTAEVTFTLNYTTKLTTVTANPAENLTSVVTGTEVVSYSARNTADPTSVLYLRGDFNSWNTDNQMTYIGNNIYSCTLDNLASGTYGFKVGSEDWSESYGLDGYGDNMSFTLSDTASVTVTLDYSTKRTSVTADPAANLADVYTATKKFQGISVISSYPITGYDWLQYGNESAAAQAGEMTDKDGDGWYEATFNVYKFYDGTSVSKYDRNYGYRIIYDAADGGATRYFQLPAPKSESKTTVAVTFHYNKETGKSYVTTDDYPNKEDVYQYAHGVSYHIAGNTELTGNDWLNNYDMNSGLMKYDAETSRYTKTYENVPAGYHEFLVVGDGTWDSGVKYGNSDGANYSIYLEKEANVTITFNHHSGIITVTTDPEDAMYTKKYVVSATGNLTGGMSWDETSYVMKYDDTDDIYYYIFEDVNCKENYAYKVVEKGVGGGMNLAFSLNYLPYSDATGEAIQKATVKVVYDDDTGKSSIIVLHPETGEDITDWFLYDTSIDYWSVLGDKDLTGYEWGTSEVVGAAAEAGKMTQTKADSDDEYGNKEDDILWKKTFTVDAPCDARGKSYAFKVVANGSWDTGISYGDETGENILFTVRSTDEDKQTCNVEIVFNETQKRVYYIIPEGYEGELNSYVFDWYIVGERELTSLESEKSDALVYDTVRDITRGFRFTSGADSSQRGITWDYNDVMNSSYDFKSKIGFSLNYDVKDYESTTEFDSEVVDLEVEAIENSFSGAADNLIANHYVEEFAPGKQWLTVKTLGYGYSNAYKIWKANLQKYNKHQELLEIYNDVADSYIKALAGYKYNGEDINESNVVAYCTALKASGKQDFIDIYNSLAKTYGDEKYGDLLELNNAVNAASYDASILDFEECLKLNCCEEYNCEENNCECPEDDGCKCHKEKQIYGHRHLRLIPTAYLEAGVDAKVSVIKSDYAVTAEEQNDLAENLVRYESDTDNGLIKIENTDGTSITENKYDEYNLALSAGYLATDKIGLGIYTNYISQDEDIRDKGIVKYGDEKGVFRNDLEPDDRIDDQFFAMSSVFTENVDYNDNYNAENGTYDNGITVDQLKKQAVIGPAYDKFANSTSSTEEKEQVAQTIVKVFKHTSDGLSKVLMDPDPKAQGAYANNYRKWIGGDKQFTAEDVGTYTVAFYWALSDGRYLEDTKEVVVTAITSALTKAVDIDYEFEGDDKLITYTLKYTNGSSIDAMNFAILDVLPFNGDERIDTSTVTKDGEAPDTIKTKMHNDNMNLKSIEIKQSSGAQVQGVYYTTDTNVQSYIKDGKVLTRNSARKIGVSNGKLTDKNASWTNVEGINTETGRYPDKTYTIDVDKATAIAVTGKVLSANETVTVKYVVEVDLELLSEDELETIKKENPNTTETAFADYIANNSYYDVISVTDTEMRKSTVSNQVDTAVIGRDITGYIWWDLNADGVVDSGEPFVSGMEAALYRVNSSTNEYEDTGISMTTQSDGKYFFDDVDEGIYMVLFREPSDGIVYVNKEPVAYSDIKITRKKTEVPFDGITGSKNIATKTDLGFAIVDRIMPSNDEILADNVNDISGLNSEISSANYVKVLQNIGLTFDTDYSVDVHKVNAFGSSLQGAEFILEHKAESQKVDESGKPEVDNAGNPVMEKNWYTVYFTEENGELVNKSSNLKTYEELTEGNFTFSEDYELVGFINDQDVNEGQKFVNGKLTMTFNGTNDSYVCVRGSESGTWYMTDGFLEDKPSSATLYDSKTISESADKIWVPNGTVTFTITENDNGTISIYYEMGEGSTEEVKHIYTFTTDEEGKISIDGLDAGTYRLTEIKSPSGHSKLTSSIYFDLPYKVDDSTEDTFVDVETTSKDEYYISSDENGKKYYSHVGFKIVDPTFPLLPQTGFDGLFITAIIGFALLAVAVILFVKSKKKKTALKH